MSRYTVFIIQHDDQPPLQQPAPNWPSCYPILYHDIEAEFTDENAKRLLRRSYFLCKLYIAMLIAHSCADIAIAISAMNVLNILAELIGSAIYLILLPIGDFFGRHLSLYVAFKHNNETGFRYYFIGEAIIILFGLVISTGFIFSGLKLFHLFRVRFYIPGIFIIIFIILAIMQTVLHIILTIQVYRVFKSRNYTLFPSVNTGPRGRRLN